MSSDGLSPMITYPNPWTHRMFAADSAKEGRRVLYAFEWELNEFQCNLGLPVTVGETPDRYIGFLSLTKKDRLAMIRAAAKKSKLSGARMKELISDGQGMRAPFAKLVFDEILNS